MSASFQANTSRLAFSTLHIAFFHSSVRSLPIMIDCSGYSGVATLALVGNFNMSWAVDGTAPRARIPGLPRIPLYCEDDLTTKKFIHTMDWYGYFPKDTSRRICPGGDSTGYVKKDKTEEKQAKPSTRLEE
ncbi:hypothetical protein Tco_1329194 [Tanacetum coccineum]